MNTADKGRVGPAVEGPTAPGEEEGEGGGKEPAADAAPGPSAAFRLMVTRREPAVKLQYAVSGLEPLAWSEDHRVSVSTARSIAVLELICDVHNPGQDLVIHRTSVPAPLNSCLLKVSPLRAEALGSPSAPALPWPRHPSPGKPGPPLVRGFPQHRPLQGCEGVTVAAALKQTKNLVAVCAVADHPTPAHRHILLPIPAAGSRQHFFAPASSGPLLRLLSGVLRLHPLLTRTETRLYRCSFVWGLLPRALSWLCLLFYLSLAPL